MAIYSDINQNTPQVKPYVYDIESVLQHIINLMSIKRGELLFNNGGLSIGNQLFELMDDATENFVRHILFGELNIQDPRVSLDNSNTKIVANYEDHIYELTLGIIIAGIKDQTYELTGILQR